MNLISGVAPARLAAGVAGVTGFLLAVLLLGDGDAATAAGNQLIVVGAGALISAFLASQLATYLAGVVSRRAGWLSLGQALRVAIVLLLALLSAGLVVAIMLLVS